MAWPPTNHQDVQDEVGGLRVTPPVHSHPVTQLTASGARSSTTFLRGDGTWAVPATGTGSTAYTFPRTFRPEDFGATGNGTTDDTAAVQAAYDAAKRTTTKRGGTVLLSALYAISAPIKFYTAVSTVGWGWTLDTTNYHVSGLKALAGFVGTTMLTLDPDGQTVPAPPGPDYSWHRASIEKVVMHGNGKTGPHGINTGWAGEASTISNVQFYNCNTGLVATDSVSLVAHSLSAFDCALGYSFSGRVHVLGLSGDNNTILVKVGGGRVTNVNIIGLKGEAFVASTHDPVVDVVDCDGGRLNIVGGWADTNSAKTNGVVRVRETGGALAPPRVTIRGLDANDLYVNIFTDTRTGSAATVPVSSNGLLAPDIVHNVPHRVTGQGNTINGGGVAKSAGYQTGATYTFVLSDMFRSTVLYDNSPTSTFTIPPNSSVAYPVGAELRVTQNNTGVVTVTGGSGVTIVGGNKSTAGQGRSLTMVQTQANQWAVIS